MQVPESFLAVDLGASNGRVIKVDWDGSKFVPQAVHRFPNGGIRTGKHLHWDAAHIWSEIQAGIQKTVSGTGTCPAGVGVDAWGVDYGLLDKCGRLLGNPYHYRDSRTEGIVDYLQPVISEAEIFRITGVQCMAINTMYQLAETVTSGREELSRADLLLLIPDLFQYFLCGQKQAEYTEATTTQLLHATTRTWAYDVLHRLRIPSDIFPPVCEPGIQLGRMRPSVADACGLSQCPPCIAVASHDTASAVAAIPSMDRHSIFLSSGTWSLMGVLSDQPDTSDEAFRLGFTNEGAADGGTLLLKNLCGLWILQECQRCWSSSNGANGWDEIAHAAERVLAFRSLIDPTAPEFQNPQCMLDAVRQFCIDSDQPAPETMGEFARCALESLCLLYRRTVKDLRTLTGRTLSAIRIVGGGSMNHLLCQMTSDACQTEVVAGPVEAATLGNAMVQAVATGHLSDFEQGRLAIGNSIHRTYYSPGQGDRWEYSQDQIVLFADRARITRLRSGQHSTLVPSR
jgi:rhamnulokinase